MRVSRLCIISISYLILFKMYFNKNRGCLFYQQHGTASTSFEQTAKKVEIASLHANATLTYFRLSLLFSSEQRCYRMLFCLIAYSVVKGHIEC